MSGIAIVSAHYYPDHVRRTTEALEIIANAVEAQLWIAVSNNTEVNVPLAQAMPSGFAPSVTLQHDNTGHEFGAYQAGLNFALRNADWEWLVVCNDTFSVHQCFTRQLRHVLVDAVLRRKAFALPSIVGQLESSRRSFRLGDARTNRWVTTSIFAINRRALSCLDNRLYCPELQTLVSADPDLDGFLSPAVDAPLRDHLVSWLFDSKSASRWYGAQSLTADNAREMAIKARSILQEKYLSARLDEASTEFVDMKEMPFVRKCMSKAQAAAFKLSAPAPGRQVMAANSAQPSWPPPHVP